MQLKTRILNVGDRVKFLASRTSYRGSGTVTSLKEFTYRWMPEAGQYVKIDVLGDDGKTYKLTEYNLIAEGY
jgi:hypothetical protein